MPRGAAPGDEITRLLRAAGAGDRSAMERVVPLVYEELRRRAARQLRQEGVGHTLQPTALAHEAWLRLLAQERVRWAGRSHFYAVAATCIRRVLVDHARRRRCAKRGADRRRVPLVQADAVPVAKAEDLLALDRALEELAAVDGRKSRVVELRFFGGCDMSTVAAILGVSLATAERDWRMARAWLLRRIAPS